MLTQAGVVFVHSEMMLIRESLDDVRSILISSQRKGIGYVNTACIKQRGKELEALLRRSKSHTDKLAVPWHLNLIIRAGRLI
jgi:hypothetical protein